MSATPSPLAAVPVSSPIPWRRIAVWFVATRLAIWAFAGASLSFVPAGPFSYEVHRPLEWLMHWDARWFLGVALEGYSFDPNQMSSVNFLPVFPMSVRAAGWLIPKIEIAGYVVSHLYCFAAAVLLWRLTRDLFGRDDAAEGAVAFFLLNPVAVFYASIYSEGAFVCFAVASMIAARGGRWLLAGVCGALAALSRSVGLLLVIPLAVEFWRQHRPLATWRMFRTWVQFACCGLPALGTASYLGFLWWRFGTPRAYSISQAHGGHQYYAPWMFWWTPDFMASEALYKTWFGGAALGGVALTLAGAVFRLPLALTGFSATLTALYLSTSREGMPRFISVVFPFYCVLGLVYARWPRIGFALLAASTVLLGFSIVLFVNGYWFT